LHIHYKTGHLKQTYCRKKYLFLCFYPQNRHLSAKVRQLVDYLAAELAR